MTLAFKIGVHISTAHRWLSGESQPAPAVWPAIVKATKGRVTINDLIAAARDARKAKNEIAHHGELAARDENA